MKNVLFILLTSLSSLTLIGQENDQKGVDILTMIGDETKSYSSMKINFTLNVKSTELNETQSGSAYTKESNFYYTTEDREVISDGNSVWTYMTSDNECYIDDIADLSDGINPSEIMTIWEDNFKIKYIEGTKENNELIHKIKLYPSNVKESKYHTIILKVNETKKQIVSASIQSKDGMTIKFNISQLTPNVDIDSKLFEWNSNKYPDVEEIDNR
jgi:outer membrane lipoprotein-sorting protein